MNNKRTQCTVERSKLVFRDSLSPLGTLASAGPDCQDSILTEATKKESLRGVPGLEISLTSLRVRPAVSPSGLVNEMTPS